MFAKLSSATGIEVKECGDCIELEGKRTKIKLFANALKLESDSTELEVLSDEIADIEFFKNTKHYLLKIKNVVLRILPDGEDFRFYVEIGKEKEASEGI